MYTEDILKNEEVKFKEQKGRALKDGYYLLYLCDFEKGSRGLLKSKNLPNENGSVCIGKLKKGIMYDFLTDTKLYYVDDIGVIYDIGEEFYYFEKPCYVNCKRVGLATVREFLSDFEINPEVSINAYRRVLNEQFMHAVSGYEEIKNSINKFSSKINKK